jgi:hypothetical protein
MATVPYDRAALCCGPGWAPLINELVEEARKRDITIQQVKQKFGALRFYIEEKPEDFLEMIRQAELRSVHICEECGADGELRVVGEWWKTECLAHHEDRKRKAEGRKR